LGAPGNARARVGHYARPMLYGLFAPVAEARP